MIKNVLIISSTLRKNGNSELLAQEFLKGAREAGHHVNLISLQGKEIKFCKGCLACQKIGHCVIEDDSIEITSQMQEADVIVFASPIYYYAISGQLKTMLDRANALFTSDYKFRDIYFLSSAADSDQNAANIAIQSIKGWIACFNKAQFKGAVLGAGTEAPGDVLKTQAIKQAYEMGKAV